MGNADGEVPWRAERTSKASRTKQKGEDLTHVRIKQGKDVGFQDCGQVPGRSWETFTNQSQDTSRQSQEIFTNQSQETSRQGTTMLRKGLVERVSEVVDGAVGWG